MKLQNFEKKCKEIHEKFESLKTNHPEKIKKDLNVSWSNWGFGLESLDTSAMRLANAGIEYIELHGNHYGVNLGYDVDKTLTILNQNNIKVAGICGMFSSENDLSSNSGFKRQNAINYIKREIDYAKAVHAGYMLVVPGAVGRPIAYDNNEFQRSVATFQLVADAFIENNIKAAIEPIRSAEVSLCHTIDDAKKYINAVNHPGVRHINGDVYHMQAEESHIGMAILEAGDRLVNLHVADSNRCALGDGSLDLDTVIMALYVIGYNREGCFVTPEPLGPGGDPYPAMHGKSDPDMLDKLVNKTVTYFKEREKILKLK